MKTDLQLKQDIESELLWDPRVNAAQIGVSVDKGTVTLLGTVNTYAEKWSAEHATKRVAGVRSLALDLNVKLLSDHQRDDTDIAADMMNALKWNVLIPQSITAKVTNGIVALEGQARWNFQREAAENAARHLMGVVSVSNMITLKSDDASAAEVKKKIEAALQRQARADGESIHVETSGGKVTLTGNTSSWHSLEDASAAAWSAHGVTHVVDRIQVTPV